jgi:SAM-dependent methyltransferase
MICVVCGEQKQKPLYTGLVCCADCGHVFASLDLDDQAMLDLYRATYFNGEEYSDYIADRAMIQRNFRARLRVLQRYLQPVRHRRLFELGCAYGFFLEIARHSFGSVAGIDICPEAIDYAREKLGLEAYCGDLLSYDLGDAEFDVACLWDTIEHLRSPDRYLERLAQHMSSGSLMTLTTGDISSLNARVRGSRWRLIHPPTHLHYFTPDTLGRLLGRYGFDVIHVSHPGYWRSVGLLLNTLLVLKHDWKGAWRAAERLGPGKWVFYMNLFDIMHVIARKR